MFRTLRIVLVCALAAGCGGGAPAAQQSKPADSGDARVKQIADTFLNAYFDRNPESATLYGVPGRHHSALTDNSLAAMRAWEAREDRWLSELKQIDASTISGGPLRATYAITSQALEGNVAKRVCRDELWPVSQMTGWQVNYGYLVTIQPVGTAAVSSGDHG
jgi:uncharacterized protein (DUF885 family)